MNDVKKIFNEVEVEEMARQVSIGSQSFQDLREEKCYYIDKTHFIKEWWETKDRITLITRPRRFGKTLNMNMLECFFSDRYAGRSDLFEGLEIWEDEEYRKLQGTYPVINLSFAKIKEDNYLYCYENMCDILLSCFEKNSFLENSKNLTEIQQQKYIKMRDILFEHQQNASVVNALNLLSELLYLHTGKKPLIFLDEYDTPMQEAYLQGYWDELVSFIRKLFNATFKTNPYLGRAVMTGITRVRIEAPSSLGSKEPRQVSEVGFPTRLEKTSPSSQCHSMFSDLNNPNVCTVAVDQYATAFGFTEEEVFASMDEFDMGSEKEMC